MQISTSLLPGCEITAPVRKRSLLSARSISGKQANLHHASVGLLEIQPEPDEVAPQKRSLKVLLVSSDQPFCSLVRAFLEDSGFCVFVCSCTERAAANFLEKSDIDLWVVDVEALGFEAVCLATRLNDAHPDTPFVVLTGDDSDEDKLLDCICGDWKRIVKPINLPDLLCTVHEAFARSSTMTVTDTASHSFLDSVSQGNDSVATPPRDWLSAAVTRGRFKRSQN